MLAAPAVPGSLQEALCILVFRYRQEQKFYELLVHAHKDGSKDKSDSFEKYKTALFPYVFKSGKDERDATKEALERAFRLGPIMIRPLKKGENSND